MEIEVVATTQPWATSVAARLDGDSHSLHAMRLVAGVVIAVFAVVLGACGSGSSRRTPAQDALIAKVDASCRRSTQELARAGLAKRARPTDRTARAAELDARVRVRERLLASLRAITPPKRDSASYQRFVAVYARRVQALRGSAHAVRVRDAPALKANGRADAKLNRQYARLSRRLGFRVCGAKSKR